MQHILEQCGHSQPIFFRSDYVGRCIYVIEYFELGFGLNFHILHWNTFNSKIHSFFVTFQSIQDPGADIGVIMYVTFIALLNLYLYCYFGHFTTNTFALYPRYFFETDWFKLPANMQKYFIILLGNSNKPLTYDGFKLISLNLETFLKVRKEKKSSVPHRCELKFFIVSGA